MKTTINNENFPRIFEVLHEQVYDDIENISHIVYNAAKIKSELEIYVDGQFDSFTPVSEIRYFPIKHKGKFTDYTLAFYHDTTDHLEYMEKYLEYMVDGKSTEEFEKDYYSS